MVSAASCSVRSWLDSSRVISRMLVARRATLSRLGARSGKSMVIRSRTTSGISRRVSRETTNETSTAAVRMTSVAGTLDMAAFSVGETARATTVPATIGVP